jgi:hypothetical protein
MTRWSDARVLAVGLGAVAMLAIAATAWIYTADLTYYEGGPIRSDGAGYYVYLPAVFLDHDLTMRRTAARSFGGDPGYIPGVKWVRTSVQAGHAGQHRPLDQFGVGEAVLIAPFFALGHALAAVLNERRDGFSWPYQAAASAAGLVYMLLGLALTASVLRRWFGRRTVVLTVLALTFGAAVFNYGTYETTWSHAYSFFLVALVVRLTLWVWERPRFAGSIALSASLGLLGLVRLTNLSIVVFCLLIGIERCADLRPRMRSLLRHVDLVAVGAAVFIVMLLPQLAYWQRIMGTIFVNPYKGTAGHLDLLHPHLVGVLFSVRKGLFFWTPVIALATAGLPLLRRTARPLLLPSVAYLGAATWVAASWSIWWYGASFGMRALIDVMPVFALGLAALIESARGVIARRALAAAVAVTTLLAVHGMVAYWRKEIPYDQTTFHQYLESFRYR